MRRRPAKLAVVAPVPSGSFIPPNSRALSGENLLVYEKLASSKINLVDAIRKAEKAANGHAVTAEFESEDGEFVFEVEVLSSSGEVVEVEIDPMTGVVLDDGSHADDNDDDKG